MNSTVETELKAIFGEIGIPLRLQLDQIIQEVKIHMIQFYLRQ